MRLRAEHANHVWSYDFVEDRTHDGRKYRMLNMVDEFTRQCLAIRVTRRLKSVDVIELLAELFMLRGAPGYIRSDNGPEFIAKAVQEWIAALGETTFNVHLNARVFWSNVPAAAWNYRLGGYQVLKKWLSYRERDILDWSLTLDEVQYFTDMARRIAAILQLTSLPTLMIEGA